MIFLALVFPHKKSLFNPLIIHRPKPFQNDFEFAEIFVYQAHLCYRKTIFLFKLQQSSSLRSVHALGSTLHSQSILDRRSLCGLLLDLKENFSHPVDRPKIPCEESHPQEWAGAIKQERIPSRAHWGIEIQSKISRRFQIQMQNRFIIYITGLVGGYSDEKSSCGTVPLNQILILASLEDYSFLLLCSSHLAYHWAWPIAHFRHTTFTAQLPLLNYICM